MIEQLDVILSHILNGNVGFFIEKVTLKMVFFCCKDGFCISTRIFWMYYGRKHQGFWFQSRKLRLFVEFYRCFTQKQCLGVTKLSFIIVSSYL